MPVDVLATDPRNQMLSQAIKNVLQTATATGAMGIGYGLMRNRGNLVTPTTIAPEPDHPIEVMSARLPVRFPGDTLPPPKKKRFNVPGIKAAEESAMTPPPPLHPLGSRLGLYVRPGDTGSFGLGQQADPKHPLGNWQIPWYGGAMLGLPAMAFAAGHAISNNIAQKKRQQNIQDEVESSRERLMDTLTGQNKAAAAIDRVFDAISQPKTEKSALYSLWDDMKARGSEVKNQLVSSLSGQTPGRMGATYGGAAVSAYAPLAVLGGLGVGAALYDHTKARDQNALIAQEARRRAARRAAGAPIEAFAVPVAPIAPR